MTDINLYQAAFVVGGAFSMIISAITMAIPQKARQKFSWLPLGKHDFVQAAIIILILLAAASVLDIVYFR